MPEPAAQAADAAFAELHAQRVERHCHWIRMYLAAGDVTRASYYADRVLCLVGKAITEGTTP